MGFLRPSFGFALQLALLAGTAGAAGVAIDVGHYLAEPGATSARGVPEFEFNRDLAREIERALRNRGHETKLIGEDGLADDLARRPREAQGMDLFISVHHDSVRPRYLATWTHEGAERRYSDMFSGFSLFVSRRNGHLRRSLGCASAIGAELRRAGFRPSLYHADPVLGENRPFADRENGVHYFDNLAVLKGADTPALLFEAGVIVNRDEELRMRDPVTRKSIAGSVASAVEACLSRSADAADR